MLFLSSAIARALVLMSAISDQWFPIAFECSNATHCSQCVMNVTVSSCGQELLLLTQHILAILVEYVMPIFILPAVNAMGAAAL